MFEIFFCFTMAWINLHPHCFLLKCGRIWFIYWLLWNHHNTELSILAWSSLQFYVAGLTNLDHSSLPHQDPGSVNLQNSFKLARGDWQMTLFSFFTAFRFYYLFIYFLIPGYSHEVKTLIKLFFKKLTVLWLIWVVFLWKFWHQGIIKTIGIKW